MFHLPSCSKPLQNLSQLAIGLPVQSVRALCPRQASIFLAFLIHRYKNPTPSPTVYLHNVYCERSISRILRQNRGLRTVYRNTASLAPDVSLPPSFPYPSPPRTQDPVQSSQPWWRLVKAAITQLKKYWAKSVDEFSPRKRRKHAKNEETNIWHYHGQYFAGKKVFNTSRGSCSRFTYALFVQRVKVFSIPFLPSRACFEKTEKC